MEELSRTLKNGHNCKIRQEELGRTARKTGRGDSKNKCAELGAPSEEWRRKQPARLNPESGRNELEGWGHQILDDHHTVLRVWILFRKFGEGG